MKKENTPALENIENPIEPMPDCKAVRESRGLTLRDLSQATKIRLSYLEAIERGDFQLLPEPIYSEMFIRTYAREVGIDPEAIMVHYRQYRRKKEPPPPEVVLKKEKVPSPSPRRKFLRIKFSFRAVGWTITALVIVAFLVSFFSSYMAGYKKPDMVQSPVELKKSPEEPAPAMQTPAADQASPAPAATGNGPVSSTSDNKVYKLVVEASETTWLNIVEDDNPSYEILLRAGERIQRESEKFSIDIGNAGGVTIYFQGKSLGNIGKSGQVIHLNLPEDSHED
jgi:cytoskeletal protein RodZ